MGDDVNGSRERVCDGWERVGVERSEEKGLEERLDGVLVVRGVNWRILCHCVECEWLIRAGSLRSLDVPGRSRAVYGGSDGGQGPAAEAGHGEWPESG